jgi:preprotein translocase subunit SecD
MLKYWRLLLLITCLLGAMLAIGFKVYPYGRSGVEIVYIQEYSPARNVIEQGMLITAVNGQKIASVDDWNALASGLSGPVKLTVNGRDYSFDVNQSIGIDVMEMERTNLDFGLDLRGGTRIMLRPAENSTREMVTQIISTLETRANIYGLKEMRMFPVSGVDGWYVQIEAAGIGSEIVDELLSRQGSFDAKIIKPVELTGGQGTLVLGAEQWPVTSLGNNTLQVGESSIGANGTIELAGITLEHQNTTQDKAVFLANAYSSEDIELVYTDPQRSGVQPRQGGYAFYFTVLVSDRGSRRFADITTGIPKHLDIETGDEYLDSMILLYLDDQLVSSLRIQADLGGQVVTSPSIHGTRVDREDAVNEKLRLQTILRSGALPTTLETAGVSIISPRLGANFFESAGWAVLLAGIAVIVIVFVRYRSVKISLPLALIGLSEVVIILGIAATNDYLIWGIVLLANTCIVLVSWWKKQEIDIYAWVGAVLIPLLGMMTWTIDLPAIGGMIAAIGTGVDHQIIIADETVKGKEERIYTLKEKIKRAFFIIFGAAATTVAAMVPLMFLGVGLVRGFAITTIVGVLVGILITRPAYAKIVEAVVKK